MEHHIASKNYIVTSGIEVKVRNAIGGNQTCEFVNTSWFSQKNARELAQFLTDFADGKLNLDD